MAAMTFTALVERQIQLLQHLSDTLMTRVLAGAREDLDNFFAVQDRLEHWLQYLSAVPYDGPASTLDAPPPLPAMRQAPPLPHEQPGYAEVLEALSEQTLGPRVQFPPEPVWVDDLEREQAEER